MAKQLVLNSDDGPDLLVTLYLDGAVCLCEGSRTLDFPAGSPEARFFQRLVYQEYCSICGNISCDCPAEDEHGFINHNRSPMFAL